MMFNTACPEHSYILINIDLLPLFLGRIAGLGLP